MLSHKFKQIVADFWFEHPAVIYQPTSNSGAPISGQHRLLLIFGNILESSPIRTLETLRIPAIHIFINEDIALTSGTIF